MSTFLWLQSSSSTDATSSTKGIVKLTQDLSGTADLPTVSKINGASIPLSGALTTGQPLLVSGSSALSYGSLNLANSDAVTGILPNSNLPSSTTIATGVVKLAGDLGGTALLPVILSLTGSAGVVIANSQLQNTDLVNNSATVLRGELIRVTKTVSLINSVGNFDTTIWQTPTRFRLISCFLRVASNITLGALGASLLSLRISTGGVELIAAYTVLGTETTSTAPVGSLLTQLGTDLISGNNYQKMYLTATTISFRNAIAAGSITAGSVEVNLIGYQF